MSDPLDRREFLSSGWKLGVGLLAAAGVWTSWDFLWPRAGTGFAARVRTVASDAVPTNTVLEIPEARAYLTQIKDEVVAISEKCPHLGCRVPFCDSSGQFECPCHGTFFNRAGEHVTGPAPRGMDRFKVEVVDGVIEIDTGETISGPPTGTQTINEPLLGPRCGADHA
jgi:cytochrome b6-f complex iron-sulfur subunit